MPNGSTTLTDLVDRISAQVQSDVVQVRDLVQAVGQASFTALLLLPAIAVVTPLSGIPLFSSSMGVLIFLVSIQMLLRRDHLWFPQWLLKRQVSGARLAKAIRRIRPVMVWLDRHLRERFTLFVRGPFVVIPQILCAATGLVMPLFEIVPFSSTLLGLAVALLALGMLVRDGLYILLGCLPYAGLILMIISAT